MRIALVSDIHANWHALEAVAADFDGVDEVVCLGDLVGYGGDPLRCVDHVRDRRWPTLAGNHDRACVDEDLRDWFNPDASAALRWTAEQLGPERMGWLGSLPERSFHQGAMLVHASPRDPVYEYVLDAATAVANLRLLGDGLCFHGHTHVPGVFRLERGRAAHDYRPGRVEVGRPALVNPGSVGQPRDRSPDASYGVWDTAAGWVEFRRVPYDRESAKRAIIEAGLPPRFAVRLDFGY